MAKEYDYDLFVIGAGSGGVRASRKTAELGKRVAVAENKYLGGTCVNVGCVPKKLLYYASYFGQDFQDSRGFGWDLGSQPKFSWSTLIENKNAEISRLNAIYQTLLTKAGVQILRGTAQVLDPHTVSVDGDTYSAEKILVACGGWPHIPQFPGSELVISSNELFFLPELPQKALIVGGGYIAVEFAGILRGLGVEVSLVYRGDLFLRGFDQDVRLFLAQEMTKKGIELLFESDIEEVSGTAGALSARFKDGSVREVGQIIYATGRKPNTAGLGLEKTAVELASSGAIKVNQYFETAEPSIYALGDVIDRVQLTPVALAEAMILVSNLYGSNAEKQSMDYENIPTAVFSQPTIGTIGLSEEQARTKYSDVAIYRAETRPMKNTLSGSKGLALIKLIVDVSTDRLIGLHLVGPEAGEIAQGFGVAMKLGVTKTQLDSTVGIHPTLAEELVTLRTRTS